jgi:O-antigen/teichoic acid export membrane protein
MAGDSALGRSAASGTLWLVAQRWVVRVTGLVTIALLTRLVTPEEFGVVAAASAVIPFVLLLSELGLSVYIVQASELSKRTLSTAFWFCLAVAATLSTALVLAAPLIAAVLRVPAAAPVIRGLAPSVVVVVLASVPMALLRRRMSFRLLAIQGTIATFAAQVVAIMMALEGAGAWALVAQLLVSQVIATVMAWHSARWLPSLQFSLHQMSEMARFGINVVLVECVSTARSAGESAVVAIFLGPVALGYLAIAQRLVAVVQDLGAAAVVPVSTVVFAKLRDTGSRLRSAYLRSIGIAYTTVAPLLGFVAVSAPVVVPTLFGPGWESSVPVAQGLAIAAIVTLGAVLDQGLFYGMGRPAMWLCYAIVIDALTLAVTAIAAQYSLATVAWGFVVVAVIATAVRWVMIGRMVDATVRRMATPLARALVPASLSVAAGWFVLQALSALAPVAARAAAAGAVGLIHVVAVRIFEPAVFTDITTLVPLPAGLRRRIDRFRPLATAQAPTSERGRNGQG